MSPARARRRASGSTAPWAARVDRLEQLRALAHPLRLRLLEVFALGPSTTKQAAERLGLPPTRLYHHVYALERAGLLRLRETRPVRGATEKYFEAVRRGFAVSQGLLARTTGRGSPVSAMAEQVVDGLREDLHVGMPLTHALPEELKPLLARLIVHADAAGIRRIRRELVALLRQRPRGGDAAQATHRYTLTLALLPAPLDAAAAASPARPRPRRRAGS